MTRSRQLAVWLLIAALTVGLVAIATLGLGTAPASAQGDDDLLLLRTSAGDVLIELFADAAPDTVAQIIAMVDAGLYDGMPFVRVLNGFVVQTGLIEADLKPLPTDDELALITNLPLEIGGENRHVRGALSLARFEDPGSGTTSFSIVLGEYPHLDGSYTVFGQVLDGMAVVDTLGTIPIDELEQPVHAIVIWKALMGPEADLRMVDNFTTVPTADTEAWFQSVPGIATGSTVSRSTGASEGRSTTPGTVAALLGALIFGIAAFLLADRIAPRFVGALGLLAALSAGFGLFVALIPGNGALASVFIFVSIVGFFRLLSRFEAMGPKPLTAQPAEQVDPTQTTESGGVPVR